VADNDMPSQSKQLRADRLDAMPDHRTLFSLAEVEAAYRRILNPQDAREAAAATMDMSDPVVPGHPWFFTNDLLELLEEMAEDLARRVRVAMGKEEPPSRDEPVT
jgi:hypothetical protein